MNEIKADTIRNYIRKNYSANSFARKHHMSGLYIKRFLDGETISEEALRMLISCIEVVDKHIFTGKVPTGFKNKAD